MATDDATPPEPVVIELEADLPEPPADAAAAAGALKAAIRDEAPPEPTPVGSEATSVEAKLADAKLVVAGPSVEAVVAPLPSASPPPRRSPPPRVRKALVEARPADDDDDEGDGEPRPPRRWPILVGAAALLVGGITAIVLAGRANHRHLYVECGATHITALRGRSFPPWGKERVGGAGWKAIAIPPATECTARGTTDPVELEAWYLDALIEQATVGLTAEGGNVDVAEAQLQQALLLARSPDRRDQRKDIDRLLADVTYRRGAAQIKGAIAVLRGAAGSFDDAAGRRPRHAADAAAWAGFARSIADKLEAGPIGEQPPSLLAPPTAPRPPAPPGVALPVEPADAGVLAPAQTDAAVPGIPSGGVLM